MSISNRTALALSVSTLCTSAGVLALLLLTLKTIAGWQVPVIGSLTVILVSLWYGCLKVYSDARRSSQGGDAQRPLTGHSTAGPVGPGTRFLLMAATICGPIAVLTGMLFQFGLGLYVGVGFAWVAVEFVALFQLLRE
jgi:hypothetical protein